MARRQSPYSRLRRRMTPAVLAVCGIYVVFLISAGLGIAWLKITCAILGIGLSALGLGYLYYRQELLRRRSLWMSAALAAVIMCTAVSLLCNYPSPLPQILS